MGSGKTALPVRSSAKTGSSLDSKPGLGCLEAKNTVLTPCWLVAAALTGQSKLLAVSAL